jgi:hypothetical protein
MLATILYNESKHNILIALVVGKANKIECPIFKEGSSSVNSTYVWGDDAFGPLVLQPPTLRIGVRYTLPHLDCMPRVPKEHKSCLGGGP